MMTTASCRRRTTPAFAATAAATALAIAASTAAAQDTAATSRRWGDYEVSAITGYQWHHITSGLKGSPILGMQFRRIFREAFTAGVGVTMGRPVSRGEFFPWNRQVYFSDASHLNDTTLIFQVSQRVTVANYLAELGARYQLERFGLSKGAAFEVSGGIGRWVIYLDPERVRANRKVSSILWQFGGGVTVPAGAATILLRVDDVIYTNWNRDILSLSDPLFSEDLWPNPVGPQYPKKSPAHNPRLSLGFTFAPGRGAP